MLLYSFSIAKSCELLPSLSLKLFLAPLIRSLCTTFELPKCFYLKKGDLFLPDMTAKCNGVNKPSLSWALRFTTFQLDRKLTEFSLARYAAQCRGVLPLPSFLFKSNPIDLKYAKDIG